MKKANIYLEKKYWQGPGLITSGSTTSATFASRLSHAGVSDLFVAQMIGHGSPGILRKYSKAIDEYRRDAARKLERMRAKDALHRRRSETPPPDSRSSRRECRAPMPENYLQFYYNAGFSTGKETLAQMLWALVTL
jgi:hypothetical protein